MKHQDINYYQSHVLIHVSASNDINYHGVAICNMTLVACIYIYKTRSIPRSKNSDTPSLRTWSSLAKAGTASSSIQSVLILCPTYPEHFITISSYIFLNVAHRLTPPNPHQDFFNPASKLWSNPIIYTIVLYTKSSRVLKISSKSAYNFVRNVSHRYSHKPTVMITQRSPLAEVMPD